MNTLIIKIIGGIIGVIAVIFLVYIITPFFISKRVDDALPAESVTDTTTAAISSLVSGTESPSVREDSGIVEVPKKETILAVAETQASLPVTAQAQSVVPTELTTDSAATIIDTKGHPAEGQVRIVSGGGKQYVRYENFKTINGPDLYVYLAKDLDAKDFISLGKLKGTEGNINYEVPSGVNVSDYKYALVWCKAFSELFNYAELQK